MAGVIRRVVGKECPSRTELVRVCGDVQLAGWRVSGGRAPSGGERQRSESSEGATELGFPGPTLGQMQGELARRAGEPSGDRKEAASQGLGGHHRLAQTDARGPACQVVGHRLHRQPKKFLKYHGHRGIVTKVTDPPNLDCYYCAGVRGKGDAAGLSRYWK